MQPTLCSRCKKNVAVIFITRIENGESHNEGLCLRCARELHIKPVDEMMAVSYTHLTLPTTSRV